MRTYLPSFADTIRSAARAVEMIAVPASRNDNILRIEGAHLSGRMSSSHLATMKPRYGISRQVIFLAVSGVVLLSMPLMTSAISVNSADS